MKSLLVCLVLAAVCELGYGEEYTISARRTSQGISPSMGLLYMSAKLTDNQNITFYQDIDEDSPCEIEGIIRNSGSGFSYQNPERLKTCSNDEYTEWDNVFVQLAEKNIFPDGQCPVKEGSYFIDRDVDITVNFDDKIDCGDYATTFNLLKNKDWAQLKYSWTIPEDDNCNAN